MSFDLNKVLDGYNPVFVESFIKEEYQMWLLGEAEGVHNEIMGLSERITDTSVETAERELAMEKTLPELCARVHRLHMEIRKVEAEL